MAALADRGACVERGRTVVQDLFAVAAQGWGCRTTASVIASAATSPPLIDGTIGWCHAILLVRRRQAERAGETGLTEEEFAEFATAHWPRLLRLAVLLGCEHHEAEEMAQSALVRCFVSWSKVSRARSSQAYASKVLMNVLRQSKRRKWWGERPTARVPEREIRDDHVQVEVRDAVERALGGLPRGQREVIVLRYFCQLTESETADALGLSPGTVKSRTWRGLQQLALDPHLNGLHDGKAP